MKRKITSLCCAAALTMTLTGCESSGGTVVRFLNFKPEVAQVYDEIAEKYREETGVELIVESAANSTYQQTLAVKMSTPDAPTIFQLDGPRMFADWRDFCVDLTDTELYERLLDKSTAITADGRAYAVPCTIEGYGIIYNDEIMRRYFALVDKDTEFSSMQEINNFQSLKALVEDMQEHREQLGIKGVFAATSLKSGDEWRWVTHLTDLPLVYEFEKNGIDLSGEGVNTVTFEFGRYYRNIFDLYINNSTVDKKLLGSKITDESMAEFAQGECAMVQNGNWAWSQISGISGNVVAAEDVKFLPIYSGVEGEEAQGLCVGTENFLCVNSAASEEEQHAALDFLNWLFTSDIGKEYVADKLGFIAPFDSFTEEERPDDPLTRQILDSMTSENTRNLPWDFTVIPGQSFKTDFGSALLQYAQGSRDWDYVEQVFVDTWREECAY